jgi:hypothetical protein
LKASSLFFVGGIVALDFFLAAALWRKALQAQDFKPEVAIQYTNSLLVRQTAFNSIESFEAAH